MASIFHAVQEGNLEEIRRTVERDPAVIHTLDGMTGFHVASSNNRVDVVGFLLDRGFEVNAANFLGMTAVHFACCNGHEATMRLLLERRGDPTILFMGLNCLMVASRENHVGVVRCLLAHQPAIPLDTRSVDGETALWRACDHGHPEVVMMLLRAGADPTIADIERETPRDTAQRAGHLDCVKLFQEWDRSYLITKARLLRDLRYYPRPAPATVRTRGEAKRARVDAAPAYLKGRMERGAALPEVEVKVPAAEATSGSVGNDERAVVVSVLAYVLCDMKAEMFVELMEIMGRTGTREE